MPRREYRVWNGIEKIIGTTVQRAIRRRYEDQLGDLLDTVLVELPEYLAQFPGEATHSPSVVYTLGKMIERGEWKVPEPVRDNDTGWLEPPKKLDPPTIFGFTGDPLLEKMPPLIQLIAETRLEKTDISPDFAIAGAIAQVAAACGNRLTFRAWGDPHHTNLYLVLVGETGKTRKSSVIRFVQETLAKVNGDLMAADTGSPEGVLSDLVDHPERIWVRDEFAGLLASMRGVDYMKQARELFLELFDRGAPYKKRLSGKGNTYATRGTPALSFLSTIQPAVMGEVLFDGRNVDSGLVNRIVLVCGMGGRDYWPANDRWQLARNQIIERLHGLTKHGVVMANAQDLEGAASVWSGCEQEAFGEYGPYVATRANIIALKIATLFQAAVEWPNGANIKAKWLDLSLSLLERWFKASCHVIADVHLKQPGERERREFAAIAIRHAHNGTGALTVGQLTTEAQISRQKATAYLMDLSGPESREWLAPDDEQRYQCTHAAPMCPKVKP